jgi:TolB-like protein
MGKPLPSPNRADAARRAAILAEVERVASSAAFDGSPRHTSLLRFLVNEVLDGKGAKLQASAIATRFFGRGESFDTAEDSIVRVEVSRLRRALERHYALSAPSGVKIELARGSYEPRFVNTQPPDPASGRRPTSVSTFPSIAIIPFISLDTDPSAQSFAQGLGDRLATLLARRPSLSLVAQVTSVDDARERNVRYALEGSIRVAAGSIRVSAHLHDIHGGVLAWGQTYTRAFDGESLFLAEDEIAYEIFHQLTPLPFGVIHQLQALERSGAAIDGVYDLTLRFPRWLSTFEPGLQTELLRACERVLRDDPTQWLILSFLSILHSLSLWTSWPDPDARRLGAELARRSMAQRPGHPAPHQALALAYLEAGDRQALLRHIEIATSLDGDPAISGMVLALGGEHARGASLVRAQMRSTMHYPGLFRFALFLDAFRRGDHGAALAEAQSIATPLLAWDPLARAVALANVGRNDEARAAADELSDILPAFAVDPRAQLARLILDEALVADLVEAWHLAMSGDTPIGGR